MLLAPGFEEIEAITIVNVLRRAGIEVTLAGTQAGPVEGTRQVRVVAEVSMEGMSGLNFDMIFLPGGQPGTDNLRKAEPVSRILEEALSAGRFVAAICAAPSILAERGYLKGKRAASHPSVRSALHAAGAQDSDLPVVVDGLFVTSRSPGTAMDCAVTMVQCLLGPTAGDAVKAQLIAAC